MKGEEERKRDTVPNAVVVDGAVGASFLAIH